VPQWLQDEESFATCIPGHQYSVGVVRLFLETVFSCAAGLRATASILNLYGCWLPGVSDTPCANSGRSGLLRLGLYELTRPKERAEDWAWIMDHTLQSGPYKCLVIVAVRLSVWRQNRRPLQDSDLALLNLTPMEHSTGDKVHEALDQTVPLPRDLRPIACSIYARTMNHRNRVTENSSLRRTLSSTAKSQGSAPTS
jgi:hypothetical protein